MITAALIIALLDFSLSDGALGKLPAVTLGAVCVGALAWCGA